MYCNMKTSFRLLIKTSEEEFMILGVNLIIFDAKVLKFIFVYLVELKTKPLLFKFGTINHKYSNP